MQKPHFGSFWHMRFFINCLLLFSVTGVLAGLYPVSRHLAAFHAQQVRTAAKIARPAVPHPAAR